MQHPTRCLVFGAGKIGLPISVSLAISGSVLTILKLGIGKVSILKKVISPFYGGNMDKPLKDIYIIDLFLMARDLYLKRTEETFLF